MIFPTICRINSLLPALFPNWGSNSEPGMFQSSGQITLKNIQVKFDSAIYKHMF